MSQSCRPAAILAAEVVAYSRLKGEDEGGALEHFQTFRHNFIDPSVAKCHGRIVKTAGDNLLVEFASVVDALRCAAELPRAMPQRNTGVAADRRIEQRGGINLGDAIADGNYLYWDSFNIAAYEGLRLAGLSP